MKVEKMRASSFVLRLNDIAKSHTNTINLIYTSAKNDKSKNHLRIQDDDCFSLFFFFFTFCLDFFFAMTTCVVPKSSHKKINIKKNIFNFCKTASPWLVIIIAFFLVCVC